MPLSHMETSSLDGAPRQTDVVGRATPVSAVSELQRAYKLTALACPQRSGGLGLGVSMCSVALTSRRGRRSGVWRESPCVA